MFHDGNALGIGKDKVDAGAMFRSSFRGIGILNNLFAVQIIPSDDIIEIIGQLRFLMKLVKP